MKKYFFLIFLIIPSWGSALTLSQIRTEIRILTDDTNSAKQAYLDWELNKLINQSHRNIVNVTWAIKKSTDIELSVGTTHYTLPSDIINIQRVTLENRNLHETSLQELDSNNSDGEWLESSGLPDQYYQDPARPDAISIFPYPDSSSSTGTLHINYYAQANSLSSDSDEPFNGDNRSQQYSDLLIYESVYRLSLINGQINRASEYRQYFESRLILMNNQIGNNPNYRPGFSSVRQ